VRKPLFVLDLGRYVAGPCAATILADFGATVIKVEDPELGGDPIRYNGPGPRAMSYLWQVEARNKRSVTLNLRKPQARRILRDLAARADVLIENFRPGTMAAWELGYQDLARISPGLVVLSVSGYGQDGPYRDRAAVDATAAAFGGLTYVTGRPDTPPMRSGLFVTDWVCALFGAVGVLEALRRRDDPDGAGRGAYIDLALYEPMLRIADSSIADYYAAQVLRERNGGVSRVVAPAGYYQCGDDSWIAITVPTLPSFLAFGHLVGSVWPTDTGEVTPECRADRPVIESVMVKWALARTGQEAVEALCDVGIPAAVVNSAADLINDPHVQARGNLVHVTGADGEDLLMQGVLPRFDAESGAVGWAGESLGASNSYLYTELLGLSENEVADLRQNGVI
jgi:crotonobetainyl-CoA:carnitine CoA-transferase CaiB-like acyl-CoA transferase